MKLEINSDDKDVISAIESLCKSLGVSVEERGREFYVVSVDTGGRIEFWKERFKGRTSNIDEAHVYREKDLKKLGSWGFKSFIVAKEEFDLIFDSKWGFKDSTVRFIVENDESEKLIGETL